MSHKLQDRGVSAPKPRRSLRENVASAAVVVFALNVAVVVVFLVGWLAGWFHISVDRQKAAQQWRLQVTMNTGRLADDMQKTVEDTQRTAASLQAAAELDTVIGRVVENDPASDRLTVRTEEGEQLTARVNEATHIEVDGAQASPAVFRPGDRVELVFREQNGQNHAVEIERLEGN